MSGAGPPGFLFTILCCDFLMFLISKHTRKRVAVSKIQNKTARTVDTTKYLSLGNSINSAINTINTPAELTVVIVSLRKLHHRPQGYYHRAPQT